MASTSCPTPFSSASYSTSPPPRWDIFLSFCGKDTRYNFTSHLYSALNRYGFITFMDDPELRTGEVISDALIEAIQTSKTYIVVFSENYANSSWCLDELVEILHCHKIMQRLVIPVFCKIDPMIVRHQSGGYKDAFDKHESRLVGEKKRIENWRSTLTQITRISGKHIHEKRSEADIIDEIVAQILLVLNPKDLPVAKYPVGLDSRLKSITTLLSSDQENVIIFGMYGMGGVGKTTLAKALYNQLLHEGSYTGSCFLANVREVSESSKGLESLQQQLINDVLKTKKNVEVESVDQGTKFIRARICSTKILVVIDDLDHPKQFESLVGSFARGSVVILTTRDEEILSSIDVQTKYRYRVNELDDAESRALFTQYAFENKTPNETLVELSEVIIRLAGGLPMALEVFGSHLSTKSEEGWSSYISDLEQIPNRTIHQKLIISLDALESEDPMLKKIFLDIACFFIGWEKQKVVQILETYYSYADYKIGILKKRCLLTVNNREELRMHDLLRDMGREIARNNSPDEPEKHSRLWISKDIYDVLKNRKGTKAIEGIILHYLMYGDTLSMEYFKGMSKLRFLYFDGINIDLNDINLSGNFEKIFEDLRWFCWKGFPLKCLPSEFHPQKLVILELPSSEMTEMWKPNLVFENLKILNMSYSLDLTTTPVFSKLPWLEMLNLEGCKSLEELHPSIRSLVKLVSLNLQGCVKLKSLPDTICILTTLKVLSIADCSRLEALPIDFGNMGSLTQLNAGGLGVSKLPDSMGELANLVNLKLNDNKNLETLPDSMCNLRALEALSIAGCSRLEALPTDFGNMKSLKELSAHGLSVSTLPDSMGRLTKLVKLMLNDNKNLETLPHTICNLRALETLSIVNCSRLEALPIDFGNMESLTELSAHGLSVSTLPDSMGRLTKLVKLMLNDNKNLETLPHTICNLRALETLSIVNCSRLEALPIDFGNMESLTELNAERLSVSKLPDSIGRNTKLVKLKLNSNKHLKTLPGTICNLRALEVLRISNCTGLETLPTEFGNIESLTVLHAWGLGVSNLPDSIGCLSNLVELIFGCNKNLVTLPDTFCNLISLESLNISQCEKLEILPDSIERLSKLVNLTFTENPCIKTLPDTICNLRSLEILNISGCKNLEILPDQLWKIARLRNLCASELTLLRKLPDIESTQIALPLQKLNLSGTHLKALPSGFSQLSNLEDLDLSDSSDRLSISGLPPNLKRITAENCYHLERLPNLSNLYQLQILDLDYCSSLTEILGLEKLTSLMDLYLNGCSGFTLIEGLGELASLSTLHCDALLEEDYTERLFQLYCADEKEITISLGSKRFPDWISESSVYETLSLGLLPSEAYKYLGMILCFRVQEGYCEHGINYSVKTSASMDTWNDTLYCDSSNSYMVTLPRSRFSITDADCEIVLSVDKDAGVDTLGIHLLYETENTMTDEYDSTTVAINELKSADPMLYDIFLDIACFFRGWKKEEVVKILETCYTHVNHHIDILKQRCLLTTNYRDELEMHDMLQHMGRKIARNNSIDEPGKHSRLWLSVDIYDVLNGQKGTEWIEGIIPRKVNYQDALQGESFTAETFKMMNKLRFLYLQNVNLTGNFKQAFKYLRWLSWDRCPLKCLPAEFYPEELVILELTHSNMITMWEQNMVSRVFEKLGTLNMSFSQDLTATPDFTKLPCLENLNLEGCTSLKEIDISIGSLARIVFLNLCGCVNLRSLPDTICNLGSLKVLDIGDCSSLEVIPRDLGKIKSLTKLNANGLTVSELPSIGDLSKLVELNLRCSKHLKALPDDICNLRALEVLDIHDCRGLEALPLALGNIISLKTIDAEKLSVSELPDSIGYLLKLIKLRLSSNMNLKRLPDTICQLKSLQVLDISECEKIKILPNQLWELTHLWELNARGATSLDTLPDIGYSLMALSLQTLDLSESALKGLPNGISQLSNLEYLEINNCCNLLHIPDLPPNLKWLKASGCTSLKRIPNLSILKELTILDLAYCTSLTEISGFEGLVSIEILHCGGCNSSLLENTFTERLFQEYHEFDRLIQIYAPEFPDWIIPSQSRSSHASHNLSGMIICFKTKENNFEGNTWYFVENTPTDDPYDTDDLWIGNIYKYDYESLMVIVPMSIFPTRDSQEIKLTSSCANIHGTHLLYKNEYDYNVVYEEYERNNPSDSDLECNMNVVSVNVEEERGYPSKRLKHS